MTFPQIRAALAGGKADDDGPELTHEQAVALARAERAKYDPAAPAAIGDGQLRRALRP